MRKSFIKTFFLVMLVSSFFIFATTASADDLYVGGGGSSDYATIQLAIDAAVPGDTINVAAGIYTETFVVDKQLTIQGAGSASTIIDASGASADYGILLTAGGTSASVRLTIKGFTIKDSPSHGIKAYLGGGLDLEYVTLEDLLSTFNGVRGMEIHNDVVVRDMIITGCEFVSNGEQGLRTASNVIVNGLDITDSTFDGNTYGIYLQGTINGLNILRSSFNNCTVRGGYMTETGPLTNMLIEDCEFNNNNDAGLTVWNIRDNSGITIRNTSFQDNARWGVLIWGDTLADVLIEECTVHNNDGLGLSPYGGIDFYTYSDLMTNVAVHFTSITGHELGVGVNNHNTVATAIVDATANWWGDASGPYDPLNTDGLNQLNLSGLGDAVTEYVLYDPWIGQGGFVTGGGTIWSEAGYYRWDTSAVGQANFGFVSRYKKGANTPDGHTNFVFDAGGLHFSSSEYDWLVVAGDTARFKGVGTIDGDSGIYKFMIWASDADPDTFRIKIWEEVNGSEDVVYDNGSQQAITGGNIFIHKEKNK